MLLTEGILSFPFKTVVKAFNSNDLRIKWDTVLKRLELVESSKEGDITNEIIYLEIKFPFPMSNREYVQKKRYFQNYGGDNKKALFYLKSVEHEDYPVGKKIVRAIMFIAGFYFEGISDNETKFLVLNHTDVKLGKSMVGLANSKAPEGAYDFVERLMNGCKMAST